METNFKIPLLNEVSLLGIGYYTDYYKGYRKGTKISARFYIDYAIDLFESAISDLIDPDKFQVRINELQIELSEFYTIEESRMVINLFKKSISLRSKAHFKKEQINFGLDFLKIDNLKYWEYLVKETIYEDFLSVEYIEYFKYKNSYTYVIEFLYVEFNDDGEVIDESTGVEIMTDQIHDYWDFEIDKKIHLQKLEFSCFTEVILTFVDGQEIFNLYMPFERLSNSTLFTDYILNREVRTPKRRKALRKISTYIIPTIDQVAKLGEAYNEFIEWYLPCWGKFYFNEADEIIN
jgi:hypothetical protein